MSAGGSVQFFDSQFQRQVEGREFALNPFEQRALDHLSGEVLDLGCGLGNLAMEAARRGHRVTAVDASPTAIRRIQADAQREGLPVSALQADLAVWAIDRDYDTIVAIGLLMFFRRERALALLDDIVARVRPGGIAIVNVLAEGTTFLGMFGQDDYYLFGVDELQRRLAGWEIVDARCEDFPAPGGTVKRFSTVVARKPA